MKNAYRRRDVFFRGSYRRQKALIKTIIANPQVANTSRKTYSMDEVYKRLHFKMTGYRHGWRKSRVAKARILNKKELRQRNRYFSRWRS